MSLSNKQPTETSKNILLIVAGSVAAFKGAALASLLTKEGHQVRTILTGSAQEFVGAALFEGLTREKVYTSAFESDEAHSHLDLSQWADLTLVYPATANLIGKWASGLGDDLASLVYLAHEGTIWVVPAMNPRMWRHPATVGATERLRGWGVRILSPDSGRMACGDVGEGRLPEPEALLQEIRTHFSGPTLDRSILVTAGGTREPIDAVRSITNTSTGETGVRIAEALAREGFQVTLLQSQSARSAIGSRIRSVRFDTFDDFHAKYRDELSKGPHSALVHAAAVSDYRCETVHDGKISSDIAQEIRLIPQPKLVSLARDYSSGRLEKLISFKLTVENDSFDPEKYQDSDVIVQNRAAEVRGETHATRIHKKTSAGRWEKAAELTTKSALCAWIVDFMKEGRV